MLLCPGAATSRRLGFGTGLVHPLGVRLVSVDRPGLGVSTPAPGRTIADFAVDVEQLVEGRGWATPVEIWYGEEDTAHSPDNGVTLTSRVPGASRRSVPGGGGSLLWTHSEPLLRRVTDIGSTGGAEALRQRASSARRV